MSKERVELVMQSVADRMVAMIEDGLADPTSWQKSWQGITKGLHGAVNASTRNRYRGGNSLLLAVLEMTGNGTGPWATYKQWEALGAQVRKGSKGTTILVPKPFTKEREDGTLVSGLFFGVATVFPSSMVDGYTAPEPGTLVPADGWIAEVVSGAQVLVAHGDPACARNGSMVYMPDREMFTSEAAWFSTFAHELTHWSGFEGRAGARVKGQTFGDPEYAAEELVAEMGAAIACSLVGIDPEPRPDHAHYLAHWLKACTGDQGAARLWDVAKYASAAVEWLDGQRVPVLVPA
jgi:antirestriction protein ArdC